MLPAWQEARQTPHETAKYFMYRLNIWQKSSTTWLPAGLFSGHKSGRFDDSDLRERWCAVGLDLARKFDLAAAVFAFQNDLGGVDLRAMFWTNAERLKVLARQVPEVLQWERDGHIRVNTGNVIDLRIIKRDLREAIQRLKCLGIVYDPTYAETIIQDLIEGELDADGKLSIPPLPIGEQRMSQGVLTQTGPVADFENDLKRGVIRHEGHPVLEWQFSHANVRENKAGHRVIEKEDRKSFRSVDGCQASVMARWGALDYSEWQIEACDYYDSNEVEFL